VLDLPASLVKRNALKKLVIGPFTKLPASLAELTNLEELDVSGSSSARLDAFPEALTRLSKLRVLNLSGHAFSELPESILRFSSLEELDLGGSLCRARRIPDLFRLPKLRVLNFDQHGGHTADPIPDPSLADPIVGLAHLEKLRMSRWHGMDTLSTFLSRIDSMPNLRVLDLSFNDFETLPDAFFRLGHLEQLNLNYCKRLRPEDRQKLPQAFPSAQLILTNM
jgi:Leucine-rich repeat (LRR) protein